MTRLQLRRWSPAPRRARSPQIQGLPAEYRRHRDRGLDVNLNYRTAQTGAGARSASRSNNTFLFNYDVIVPTATGVTDDRAARGPSRAAPTRPSPSTSRSRSSTGHGTNFGASLTGRYIKSVDESATATSSTAAFYTDVQLRWFAPSFADNFGFALGVNNLFDKDPPGCFTCGLNNFDPTTYDVPGRYLLRPRHASNM